MLLQIASLDSRCGAKASGSDSCEIASPASVLPMVKAKKKRMNSGGFLDPLAFSYKSSDEESACDNEGEEDWKGGGEECESSTTVATVFVDTTGVHTQCAPFGSSNVTNNASNTENEKAEVASSVPGAWLYAVDDSSGDHVALLAGSLGVWLCSREANSCPVFEIATEEVDRDDILVCKFICLICFVFYVSLYHHKYVF